MNVSLFVFVVTGWKAFEELREQIMAGLYCQHFMKLQLGSTHYYPVQLTVFVLDRDGEVMDIVHI
jgi:hypothetical protein